MVKEKEEEDDENIYIFLFLNQKQRIIVLHARKIKLKLLYKRILLFFEIVLKSNDSLIRTRAIGLVYMNNPIDFKDLCE